MQIYLENFMNFFKHLSNDKNNNDFVSTNILVSSKFGYGKTTLKNEIKECKELNEKYIIVDVNIWQNSFKLLEEQVLIDLLYILKENKIFNWKEITKTYGKKIVDFILQKQIGFNPINKISDVYKNVKNNNYQEEINFLLDKYKINNALSDIIDFVLKKDKKIILLFDELDRCSKEYINHFFTSLKQLLNKEIINIVFANEDYLDDIFKNNLYKEEKYIDKFFSNKYYLRSNPITYIKEILSGINLYVKDYIDNEFDNDIQNIIFVNVSFRDINKNKIYIDKFIFWVKEEWRKLRAKILNDYNDKEFILNRRLFSKFYFLKLLFYLVIKGNTYIDEKILENLIKNDFRNLDIKDILSDEDKRIFNGYEFPTNEIHYFIKFISLSFYRYFINPHYIGYKFDEFNFINEILKAIFEVNNYDQ